MPKQGHFSISLVCTILGIMLALQFRTTQDVRSSLQYQRAEDLTGRIAQVEKERSILEGQIRELRQNSVVETSVTNIENIRMAAGIQPLEGTGIIITMADTKFDTAANNKNGLYLIKDEDILKVLNELRAADAEAISINDQRIIASTEIRTAGQFVSVNNTNITAPFEIKAIGDSGTLENALKIRGGIMETLQFWGIQVSVKQSNTIQIPAFKKSYRFQFAKPIHAGGAS